MVFGPYFAVFSIKPKLYTTDQYTGVMIADNVLSPAFTIVDLLITYDSAKNWSLNLYCNNAFYGHYFNGSVPQATLVNFAGAPRTTGVTLNVKF